MAATSSSSTATIAESLEMQSAADVADALNVASDAVLPELTETTVKSEKRLQTLTTVTHDLTSTTTKHDAGTEALSPTLLPSKTTLTISDPKVATFFAPTVATTLTSTDTSTTESDVPRVKGVDIDGISSTVRLDTITTATKLSEVEAAMSHDQFHSDLESTTVPESDVLSQNAATESEVSDISTALPQNDDNVLTTGISTALTPSTSMLLKSKTNMALSSNSTSALSTKAPTTLTSVARSSLKSEFQTAPASNLMTGLTSGTETLSSKVDTTAALQLTTTLTSKLDRTSVAYTSQNVSRIPAGANTSDSMTQEISSAVPVRTSAVAGPTSVAAELGTTTLVSPSATSIPRVIETSGTTRPVKLSSRLSTGRTKPFHTSTRLSAKDTSAKFIPTKHGTSAFIATSTIGSSPTTSQASSSLSYTFSTKIGGQSDLFSLATTDRMKRKNTTYIFIALI